MTKRKKNLFSDAKMAWQESSCGAEWLFQRGELERKGQEAFKGISPYRKKSDLKAP